MAVMIYRYATEADAPTLAELFAANRDDALGDQQRREEGFVQGNFDAAALAAMAGERGLLVADSDGRIAGFLGLSAPVDRGTATPPPVRALLQAQDTFRWDARPLSAVRWLLYGPVVVDAAFRGQGVARGLFDAALEAAAGRAEALVAFIEVVNRHSLLVHVDGFGMHPLGNVVVGERIYTIVAAAVPALDAA